MPEKPRCHPAHTPASRVAPQDASSPPARPTGTGLGGHPASQHGSLGRELPRQACANDRAPRGNLILEKGKCCKDPLLMATGEMSTCAPPAVTSVMLLHVPNVPPSGRAQPRNAPGLLMLLLLTFIWGEGGTSFAFYYFSVLEIHICSAPNKNLSSHTSMG